MVVNFHFLELIIAISNSHCQFHFQPLSFVSLYSLHGFSHSLCVFHFGLAECLFLVQICCAVLESILIFSVNPIQYVQ